MIYRIKDWAELYENSTSRKIRYCSWVPVPNKQDGLGYTTLITGHRDGAAHYGLWLALVCICSKQEGRWYDKESAAWMGEPREGLLTDNGRIDGTPLTDENIHLVTRIPKRTISTAISRLIEIKWLEVVNNTQPPTQVESDSIPVEASRYILEQNRTEQNRTEVRAVRTKWFDEFWTKGVWEDLRGRSKALDAWLDLDLDQQLFEEICKGAIQYQETRRQLLTNGSTPKMAQGWLNDRRWEDEPPTKEEDEVDHEALDRRREQDDAQAEANLKDPEWVAAREQALASVKGLAGKMGAG